MEGSMISQLFFSLVLAVTVMAASWGLQRLDFFKQAKTLTRVILVAATIFAVSFVLQLLWPYHENRVAPSLPRPLGEGWGEGTIRDEAAFHHLGWLASSHDR